MSKQLAILELLKLKPVIQQACVLYAGQIDMLIFPYKLLKSSFRDRTFWGKTTESLKELIASLDIKKTKDEPS